MPDRGIGEILAPQRLQPTGFVGSILSVPEVPTDRLKVTIESFSGDLPFEAAWDLRADGVAPSEGDTCLVHLDDKGGAWIDKYWPYD